MVCGICFADPDIFGRPLWAEQTNARALGLGRGGMDREGESVGAKGSPYPLIKAMNIKRLPTHLKLAYSRGMCKRHGWITHVRIAENPVIRGTRSLL